MRASRRAFRSRARQWSRAAWALTILFASLPISSRLFLGVWGFDAAAGVAGLCLFAGIYLHILSRRSSAAIPDPAEMLDAAIQLARAGAIDDAIHLLTKVIDLSPQLWQAFQYRGKLYLSSPDTLDQAVEDFTEAIRLMPDEPHLHELREQAHSRLNPGNHGDGEVRRSI